MWETQGLLQVLWERDYIDEQNASSYSLKGNACQLDEDGQVLSEYWQFVLHSLMVDCGNFKSEKSAKEMLLEGLNLKAANNQSINQSNCFSKIPL